MDNFPSDKPVGPPAPKVTTAQKRLAGFLLLATLASIAAWSLSETGLEGSGLLFIAVPAAFAMMLTLAPFSDGKTTISLVRGSTIGILASAIVVREGFICVIMALPLIIPIIALAAWGVRKAESGRMVAWAIPLLLFGAAGEGAVYELPTNVTVTESRVIDASASELDASLHEAAELPEIRPLLFALPFPLPSAFTGEGADVGDIRTVEFGEEAAMGQLVLQVTDRSANHITWDIVDNSTPVADWMTINAATAAWTETPEGLQVSMEIDFDRELAPAFYFDPLERWGVGEMAEVLLDMLEHNINAVPTEAGNG